MKWWAAILLTLVLLTIAIVVMAKASGVVPHWLRIRGPLGQERFPAVLYMALPLALWAAIDAARVGVKRYKTVFVNPIVAFLIVLFWPIGLPWYLIVRGKIKDGSAVLKDEYRVADTTGSPTA